MKQIDGLERWLSIRHDRSSFPKPKPIREKPF
jgi:hypothetical protein